MEPFAPATGLICGVDEAGRGPLAGPVFAAAVILDRDRPISGLTDSKKLAAGRRERLAALVRERAFDWAVAQASVDEIDAINILQASLLAMRRAVEALRVVPHMVLVDGCHSPRLRVPTRTVIRGDASVTQISAASILAKTFRDAEMLRLHERYPAYRFDRHKGYPTAEHLRALRDLGPSEAHRRSFAPVRAIAASV
jgi:ribonuclease HII